MASMSKAKTEEVALYQESVTLDTHYSNRRPLVHGLYGHILACVVCYFDRHDMAYLFAAAWMTFVNIVRCIDMLMYDRATAKLEHLPTRDFLKRWKRRYALGVYSAAGSFGVLGGYACLFHTETLAATVTVGIACGCMISIVGRNFGDERQINILTLVCGLPMVIGLCIQAQLQPTWVRSLLYLGSAAVVVPLMLVCRSLAMGARNLFKQNETNIYAYGQSKQWLQIALNNMPNGLLMMNEKGEILVHNQKVASFLGMSHIEAGRYKLPALLRLGSQLDHYTEDHARELVEKVKRLESGQSTSELMTFKDPDRIIEASGAFSVVSDLEALGLGLSARIKPYLRRKQTSSVLVFEDVTDQLDAQKRINRMATTDGLSDLPNRGHFMNLIAEAASDMPEDSFVALAVFDIDSFKSINDRYGHAAGDMVIKEVARRLRSISDPRAILCRSGGDEFVVAFHSMTNRDNVPSLFDAVFGSMCGDYVVGGRLLSVKVSGGVVCRYKKDFELDAAISDADMALYKTKALTKSGNPVPWQLFSETMATEIREEDQFKEDLRTAIRQEAFTMVYQPMRTPDGRSIACCEALVRWTHPTRGFVRPDVFIQKAEEMGEVSEITRIVINKACRDAVTWPEEVSISVNLSAIDLNKPDVINVIQQALDASGLSPARFQVEVTETVFVKDINRASEILAHLRDLGIKTALDDFGVGFSSLSKLTLLPLDKVKIDKSFVDNVGLDEKADKLFKHTVQLAKGIGFEVVVEGVEDKAQLERVVALTPDVDLVQGYVFSKPVGPAVIRQMLAEQPPEFRGNVVEIGAARTRETAR
ncbi:EAL domain-containing protein [Rhizobium leguminosarum]|uniref:sensor domain-containing protein n=1 Tax=Rhizobium leguminosarum TaxID=384 RepID=UPI002E113B21|nr:EAL domain-containing protein [Rhizobium leguminosarum]